MNDLRRELAPITDDAWKQVEDEARRTLKNYLAARKLVDLEGPKGWDHSVVNLGRVEELDDVSGDIRARRRQVLPLLELRADFELDRHQLDSVERGADPDLDPLVEACRRLAYAEDRMVFHGHDASGMGGVCEVAAHDSIRRPDDFIEYPGAVAEAANVLRSAGIAGPYALALSPEAYTGLTTTVRDGYPVMKHVRGIVDGPIVWAPALDGALVLSMRGGDFELTVGRDISIGYADHDDSSVCLYLEESLAFRVLEPEAAVSVCATD